MKKEKKSKRIEKKVSKPTRTKKAAVKKSPAKKTAKRLTKTTSVVKAKAPKKTVSKVVAKKMPAKKIQTPASEIKKVKGTQIQENSQYNTVMNHLIKYGSINTVEAVKQYNVYRLGAVIFNLRQGGMDIKTSVHTFENNNGRKSNVAKYILQ